LGGSDKYAVGVGVFSCVAKLHAVLVGCHSQLCGLGIHGVGFYSVYNGVAYTKPRQEVEEK